VGILVGRSSSAIGLIFAAVFMIVVGYLLTLDVYQNQGPYVIFYSGRYYGGIACIIVGVVLFLSGIILPFAWPVEKKKAALSSNIYTKRNVESEVAPKYEVSSFTKTPAERSLETKIRGVYMQSTCGEESIKILKLLLQQKGDGLDLPSIGRKCFLDDTMMKKTVSLLLNLGLIERSNFGGSETYMIPERLEPLILKSINNNQS
jgi:hypothetical protein